MHEWRDGWLTFDLVRRNGFMREDGRTGDALVKIEDSKVSILETYSAFDLDTSDECLQGVWIWQSLPSSFLPNQSRTPQRQSKAT